MTVLKWVRTALLGVGVPVFLAGTAMAKTLVYCSESSPEGFDPALYTSQATFDASSRQIYDRLVAVKPGTAELVPGLAENWRFSEDGREVTFNLRKGVTFHATHFFTPARELTADDVLFSIERQLRNKHPWNDYIKGADWEYFQSTDLPGVLRKVEKIDDHTVRFVLRRPYAPLLAVLAMDFASIVSEEYAAALLEAGTPEQLNKQPVGTGPFAFVDYDEDTIVHYQAHATYWGGKPALDELVFSIVPDEPDRLAKFKNGECHVAAPFAADVMEGLKTDPETVLLERPSFDVSYLAFNTREKPFDQVAVRQALALAINKQTILKEVFGGGGRVAHGPLPSSLWNFKESGNSIRFDPPLAKKLLEDAGASDISMKIWAMPVAKPYSPDSRRVADLIKKDLERIGVTVEIVSYSWGQYLSRSKSLKRDGAVLFGWTGVMADPDAFLTGPLSCEDVGSANRAQWCNENFDALVKRARQVTDVDERAELYRQALEIFDKDLPWVPLVHASGLVPVSADVIGYTPGPLGGHFFPKADLLATNPN